MGRARRERPGLHAARSALALAGLLALALAGGPAWAAVADQVGATFGLMLQDIVDAFPPVEGIVVAVDGERLYLDLGEPEGVRPGQEFTVFRKGDVFRHPLTARPLGRYEDVLGYARVERVEPRFSEAVFVPANGQPPPRPEDGVRITRGRIRVAVAPVADLTQGRADLRRVPFMIAHALDETKRFQTVDPGAVQEALLDQKIRSEELLVRGDRARAAGKALDVNGFLVPVLLERRGTTYLDVTWVSAVTGTALFSRRMALIRPDTVAEQRFPWEPLPVD